jgi:hypothetical protein
MSTQFTPDISSFERLLAAAWILQCQRDGVQSDAIVAVARTEKPGAEGDCYFDLENPFQELKEKEPRIEDGATRPDAASESASVAVAEKEELVAEDRTEASDYKPALTPASPSKIDGARDHALLRVLGTATATPTAEEERKQDGVPITLRIVIPTQSMKIVSGAVAPVVLLLIMCGFLLSWPFGQKAAQASQRLSLKSLGSELKASLQSDKVNYKETAKASGNAASTPGLETSHQHITDAVTASVVNDLSPYEIQALARQAQYGDQFAALALGMAYETGHYVHPSCTKAAEWIAFAAANGNAAAQYNLALRYFQGDGLPQDFQEGRKWLQSAASRGYPKAAVTAQLH